MVGLTFRERQLEGICKSQRLELHEAREALDKLTAALGDVEAESGAGRDKIESAKPSNENTISGYVAGLLASIDDLVGGLHAATSIYRGRPHEWSDVDSLGRVQEHLSKAVGDFNSAQAAAQLSGAARQVARDVRQFREMDENHEPTAK
jgi:hypothetical protein